MTRRTRNRLTKKVKGQSRRASGYISLGVAQQFPNQIKKKMISGAFVTTDYLLLVRNEKTYLPYTVHKKAEGNPYFCVGARRLIYLGDVFHLLVGSAFNFFLSVLTIHDLGSGAGRLEVVLPVLAGAGSEGFYENHYIAGSWSM